MARELTQAEKSIIRIIRAETTDREATTSERAILAAISTDAGLDAVLSYSAELYAAAQAPTPAPEVKRETVASSFGLTDREAGMLVTIAESEFMDGDPTGQTWANVVCKGRGDAALVGSLNKKGLVASFGSGREATIELTSRGLMAYRSLRPETAYARECDERDAEQAQAERAHANL